MRRDAGWGRRNRYGNVLVARSCTDVRKRKAHDALQGQLRDAEAKVKSGLSLFPPALIRWLVRSRIKGACSEYMRWSIRISTLCI